jgi:hypothetical protein
MDVQDRRGIPADYDRVSPGFHLITPNLQRDFGCRQLAPADQTGMR